MAIDLRNLTVAVVSTFPPTRCGVGRFSDALCRTWRTTAPGIEVQVNRAVTGSDSIVPNGFVTAVFDPSSPSAVRCVARRMGEADVALIQHEFGIFGPDHGEAVACLVTDTAVPVVSVLHTVLADPGPERRRIVESLAARGPLVVPTEVARRRLLASVEVDPSSVHVIRHGTVWSPLPVSLPPHRKLISWGLLGPGKGIERALEALAQIEMTPAVTYQVIGQTHPRVREREGEIYRHSLEELTRHLGLESRVRFIDRYMSDDELHWSVAACDVAVIPYDDPEQACSGTLVDAVALGKPVVATSFPHARELLAEGGGRVVEHDARALAEAIVALLEDEEGYARAARRAAQIGSEHRWEEVGLAYSDLLRRVRLRAAAGGAEPPTRENDPPALDQSREIGDTRRTMMT